MRRGITRARVLLAFAALLSTGCAQAAAGGGAQLTFPEAASPRSLAATSLYTSPDGGIYQNPDHLDVDLVQRQEPDAVFRLLPGSAPSWQPLRVYGGFTFIGVALRNDGKAGSDPQLNALQIASDFAPPGTATGSLRQYYHPMFPLAMLSQSSSDANCTVHIDPGQHVIAVLVYPPIDAGATIVWGVYKSFALRIAFGGALPQVAYAWRATACLAPQATPS